MYQAILASTMLTFMFAYICYLYQRIRRLEERTRAIPISKYCIEHDGDTRTVRYRDDSTLFKNCQFSSDISIRKFISDNNITCINLSDYDCSDIEDMSYMFYGCTTLNRIDLSNWDVSHVSNMQNMFWRCSSLEYVNLSGWNFKNIDTDNIRDMFNDCLALKTIIVTNDIALNKLVKSGVNSSVIELVRPTQLEKEPCVSKTHANNIVTELNAVIEECDNVLAVFDKLKHANTICEESTPETVDSHVSSDDEHVDSSQ